MGCKGRERKLLEGSILGKIGSALRYGRLPGVLVAAGWLQGSPAWANEVCRGGTDIMRIIDE